MSASAWPLKQRFTKGELIDPSPETLYTVLEVSADGSQLRVGFEYGGERMECWVPAAEFRKAARQ